jgi:uncharacterized RmlC-like cupin family protein
MRMIWGGLIVMAAAGLHGQNPNVKIENGQARVLLVTDEPHRKSALHEHAMNRVMIYLDAGRQRIVEASGKVENQSWKAGEVAWSPARGPHTSENITGKPFRIVEVELRGKPQAVEMPALDPVKVDPKHYKVVFDNDQVRVLRVRYGPGENGPMHEHALNRVVAYLTAQSIRVTTPGGKSRRINVPAGEVRWAGPAKHQESNLSQKPFEAVVVELKTR